jgi:hypothetical protein
MRSSAEIRKIIAEAKDKLRTHEALDADPSVAPGPGLANALRQVITAWEESLAYAVAYEANTRLLQFELVATIDTEKPKVIAYSIPVNSLLKYLIVVEVDPSCSHEQTSHTGSIIRDSLLHLGFKLDDFVVLTTYPGCNISVLELQAPRRGTHDF